MKADTQTGLPGRTYEMLNGEWREVEPPPKRRWRSLLRGLGALAATACAVGAIAVIGIVATAVALVLWPLALFAAWGLGTLPVQGTEERKAP